MTNTTRLRLCAVAIVLLSLAAAGWAYSWPAEMIMFKNQTFAGYNENKLDWIKVNIMTEMLLDVHYLFMKHGIAYWAMEGTLLGIVRHGTILPWDHDTDIGILIDQHDLILKVLQDKWGGDVHTTEIGTTGVIRLNRWADTDAGDLHCWIDMYGFNHTKGSGELNPHEWVTFSSVPINYIFPVKFTPFAYGEVALPAEPEKVLTMAYGEYRKPYKIYNLKERRYDKQW